MLFQVLKVSLLIVLIKKIFIMASRRKLKKEIGYVIGDIFTECLVYANFVPGTDREAADKLILDLLKIDDEFISRINHTEQGNAKKFYRSLYNEFNDKINAIITELGKLKK